MADIELIIKIPEEVYEKFGREYREEGAISKRTNDTILDAVCNGEPLPQRIRDMIDMADFDRD